MDEFVTFRQSWGLSGEASFDPSGRIFNWDLRCGVASDGRVATFAWTYDAQAVRYLNIHRRISTDHGHTWSAAEDLGITDQPGHPAMLPDGRVLLVWVDRFQSQAIRARLASSLDGPFDPASEIFVYQNDRPAERRDKTGALLAEMSVWTYGLHTTAVLPDGDVLLSYYAETDQTLDIHWARIRV